MPDEISMSCCFILMLVGTRRHGSSTNITSSFLQGKNKFHTYVYMLFVTFNNDGTHTKKKTLEQLERF